MDKFLRIRSKSRSTPVLLLIAQKISSCSNKRILLFFDFQVEFYTTFHVKYARITVLESIMEYLHAMDAPGFLKDRFAADEITCATKQKTTV